MSDFDAALERGGSLVAAWDDFDDDRTTLALFEIGAKGAKRLAETNVPRDEHQRREDQLVERGVRIGYTVGNNDHVWAIDEDTATVWSATRVELEGNRASLKVAGKFVPGGDVRRVIAFYSQDRVQRGVRLRTKDGELLAAEERDDGASDDPFYNQDNLVIDAQWASYLANDLATWLGVPLDDQIMHIDNASQLRIAKAAHELATQTTAEVIHSLGVIDSLGEVKLRRAASPAGGAFLEVIIAPGGKPASRWIRQGTVPQIAATLRSVRLPRLVLDAANALLAQR